MHSVKVRLFNCLNSREICDQLGIASYTIDDIDKDGIGVIIEKALERINPK